MNRISLLKKLWVPLLSCIGQLSYSQTFTLSNWYALSNHEVTEADDCGTIMRVVANFDNWSPAQFQILKDGVPMGTADLVSKDSQIYYEGNGSDPAWRCSAGSSQSWSYTFYINTRVTPYQIVSSIPTEAFNTSKASISKGSAVVSSPTETFTLSGKGCSSNSSATFSYQWVKSSDGKTWSNISKATEQDYTTKLEKDSTYFALKTIVVYDEEDEDGNVVADVKHECISAPILMTFKKAKVNFEASVGVNSHKFNDSEFEVKEGGNMVLTALTESFEGTPTYTLQYKSLERASEEVSWVDLKTLPNGKLTAFEPEVSAEYRVKVTGTSKYSGQKCTVYSPEVIAIRKIYLVDTEKFAYDVLWRDDFGSFASAKKYVDALGNEYSNSFKDETLGKECTIENYWAPDPFGYVKEHQYAAFDPNFINNQRNWCSKYRLEDGYYIITNNPYKGDGKNNKADRDYWEAEDHTAGDTDGAMLFVNCKAGLEGAMIYERSLSLNCELTKSKGVWVIFNAFINNAVYKEGSDTPVNVRLEILDPDGKVVYSIASGNINQRKGSLSQDSWANLSFRFLAEAQDYTVRLYNNAPGGASWGNDILIDDISVTLCYPKVSLVTHDKNHASYRNACKDEQFELVAYNEDGLENYIGDPKFLFQYSNKSTDGAWVNYGGITNDSIVKVKATSELFGVTKFRVIVASDESVVKALGENRKVDLSCATVYAMDENMVVTVAQPFELSLDLSDSIICLGQDSVHAVATPIKAEVFPTQFYWYLNGAMVDSTESAEFAYADSLGGNWFDKIDTYELEVRAVDSVCQKTIKEDWAETNKATVEVTKRSKLGLSVSPTQLAWGEEAVFSVENNGYEGDSLIWHELGTTKRDIVSERVGEYKLLPSQNGDISYYVSATEEYVCTDPSDTVTINVNLIIPNLITPFNDGSEEMNNTFMQGKGMHVEIFNRYHQLIFEGEDGWDGSYKGKTAEPGTYYYRLFMPNGEIRKGTLEVGKFK